jgi:hypothetical protein
MSNLLPVIDILNNVRTISNFLYTSQQTTLTPNITTNNSALATEFVDWQQDIYNEYFEGFLSENLNSQTETIQLLYTDGVSTPSMQSIVNSILIPTGNLTPGLIVSVDSISNLIVKGSAYATSLDVIAKGIQGADQKKVDDLMTTVATLSSQFQQQEDKLVSDSINLGVDTVVTAVNIAIAVGSEGETIQPMISSISKVGTDAINALILKDSINQTIVDLQNAWNELDKETEELARITLIVNQLEAVTTNASATLTALNNVASDWQLVVEATQVSDHKWIKSESNAVQEWCSRMVLVSFGTFTQTV